MKKINQKEGYSFVISKLLIIFFVSTLFCSNTKGQEQIKLERIVIKSFELRWKDSGSGNGKDLAFWHPIGIPNGYYVSGSWGSGDNNENPNTNNSFTYAWKTSDTYKGKPAVVPAIGLKQVWTDKGSGADWDGSLYSPECPPGYTGVGLIANRSHSKPDLNSQKCGCFENSLLQGVYDNSLKRSAILHTWNGEDTKSLWNPIDDFSGDVANVRIVKNTTNPRRIFVPSRKLLAGNSENFPFNEIKLGTKFYIDGVNANSNNNKYHNKIVTLRIKYTGNDNRMLDADGNTLGRNGTKVQTWPFINNNKNQEWKITSVGNGLYNITSESPVAGKYKFLEIDGNCVGQNGCKLQLWEKHHYGQQLWRIIENGDGTVHIQNASPAVKNGSSIDFGGWPKGTNGKQAKGHQYIKTNYNQKWYLHILR